MLPLVLRLVVVFVVGVWLGSVVNWAVDTFAWQPPSARRTGVRPLLVRIGLGAGLAWLYWWEIARLGLLHDQLGGFAVVPPSWPLHLQFISQALLICWMLAASLIDIDEKIIPDEITVTGTLLGLVLAASAPISLLPSIVVGAPARGVSGVPLMRPADGQAVDAVGRPIGLEPTTTTSPNVWPPAWGRPRHWESLLVGLFCYWLWCFALAPRIWRGRRGPVFALRLIAARLRREFGRPPMRLLFVTGTAAIICVWTFGASSWAGLLTSLVGLVASGGIVWAVRIIGSAALGKEAMGFGDVTLMMMIGTFLGWQASLITFFVSPFAALVVGLIQFAMRRGDVIPFGPFL
ncbi:MAG TPA: A24 family peptidase, partial [Lacipirellulaceae bacterium]|nr:A24 family peptidase [Lacipirellulaceae bacterium]